ncbi:MAG: SagB/ThcOx family dehydrogenase [Desulfobulbaceae bacterium]|nr:MAG: SagB/ThcOx family dehydrogenase [Desulfobulbaceae bacterium]
MSNFKSNRDFLKDSLRKTINFRRSDQSRGIPTPSVEKGVPSDAIKIILPTREEWRESIPNKGVVSAIGGRKSRRSFSNTSLSLEELSFLLWATQGIRDPEKGIAHFRTVPSAGARHSFETYVFVHRVEKVPQGLYRFLPLSNELVLIYESDRSLEARLSEASFGQKFVATCAATFVWTTIPYRMEWRYLDAAHRVILLDAGHVCQNLYLACENIEAGTCAIAAYDQEAMDTLLRVDGEDEFTVYLAPVGKI